MIRSTLFRFFSLVLTLGVIAACNRVEIKPPSPTSTAVPASPVLPAQQPNVDLIPISTEGAPIPAAQWWDDTIFYEVFVRSFQDSDGDGVGDLTGLIERLDYLNDGDPGTNEDLGITGIWLMPVMESPSYHGYDVVDYYSVDQEYGSEADFKRLIQEAHARGIRVIIDLVLNHTGVDHPWFQAALEEDPGYRDFYLWAGDNPAYEGPWDQEVWHRSASGYYYGLFWSGMPDLNLENPAVTEELYAVARFWLEEMEVDGFRLDAIKHLVEDGQVQENTAGTHAWLQAFHDYYQEIDPGALTIGEAWTSTPQVVDYTGDEVDIAFEFDLAQAFLSAAQGPLATPLINQMQAVVESLPPGQYGVFLANHDQNRVMSMLDGDVEGAKLAATLLLTSPGVPFLYYGEEIGMTGIKPDEDLRRPMQWLSENNKVGFTTGRPWRAPASDYRERSVALQSVNPMSLLNHYRDLLHLREKYSALRTGAWVQVEAGTQRLYAILRYDGAAAFLILVNVHPQPLRSDQYALSLAAGPFEGAVRAVTHLGVGGAAAPVINARGGFVDYRPFEEIPARSGVVLQLVPGP
jgi:glycosidase